jgi:hypothetical protein
VILGIFSRLAWESLITYHQRNFFLNLFLCVKKSSLFQLFSYVVKKLLIKIANEAANGALDAFS